MNEEELTKWFISLPVWKRIILTDKPYPESTQYWNSLTFEGKNSLYESYVKIFN